LAVTIIDIARHVGVTPTTVSKVLNRAKSDVRISETTRRKIMSAVKTLNYRPSFSARALRKGRTFSLGYLCGDIDMPYFSEMTSLALKEAEARGYHLLVSVTEWDYRKELDCMEMLLNRGVDGAIACSEAFRPGVPLVEDLRKRKFPLVTLTSGENAFPSVTSDWREGMRLAAEHLHAKGHQRIGYVGLSVDPENSPNTKFSQLAKACAERGMPLERNNTALDTDETRNLGVELAKRADRPNAFVVYSDYLAMSFMAGLQDAGLRIPEDAAVIGIDGTNAGGRIHPALTSVAQDLRQMTVRAMDMVLDMLNGKDVPAEITLVPTKLIVRQST
jgi:DNA-binding LacI/PurR family transcriptional regulator